MVYVGILNSFLCSGKEGSEIPNDVWSVGRSLGLSVSFENRKYM